MPNTVGELLPLQQHLKIAIGAVLSLSVLYAQAGLSKLFLHIQKAGFVMTQLELLTVISSVHHKI